MRKEHVVGGAVPGKSGGFSSTKDVYKLKTADGYKAAGELISDARTFNAATTSNPEMADAAALLDGATGTSIFDPVLCELAYRWFSPPGGAVLDPFAGGSVRGITAAMLGRRYVGVDLSSRQLTENRTQAEAICPVDLQPLWVHGNSLDIEKLVPPVAYDFVFSCPPYADLEVYSNDPRDLSSMPYARFVETYRQIIAACVRLLRNDRFACFVVGEVRGKDGFYYGFVPDTVRAFVDAGARYYNEAILVTAVGSLPVRAGRQFAAGRKLGKTHQNLLVFCKGDPKRASNACGEL